MAARKAPAVARGGRSAGGLRRQRPRGAGAGRRGSCSGAAAPRCWSPASRIEVPERFLCDEGVEVGPDTVVEPDVRLRGATRIGPGCTIGQGSVLADAVLAAGVTVRPYTVIEGPATVGRAGHPGPVLAHPARLGARRGDPRRQLRGDQEDPARQGLQGQPPRLPGRRGDRRRGQRGGRHHHLQLRRREEAPDPHRRRRLHRLRLDPGGPHRDRRRGLRGRRLDGDPGGAGRRAGPGAGPAGQQGGLGGAEEGGRGREGAAGRRPGPASRG